MIYVQGFIEEDLVLAVPYQPLGSRTRQTWLQQDHCVALEIQLYQEQRVAYSARQQHATRLWYVRLLQM